MNPYRHLSTLMGRTPAALVLAASFALSAVSAPAQQSPAAVFRPGLLLHSARGVAYVMTPDGGIAAVDLTNGAAVWSTHDAAMPLALVGNLLVAQVQPTTLSNRLQLVTLNTQARGARVGRGVAELPAGVQVSIGETPHGNFSIDARASAGNAVVTWTFVSAERRGMEGPADTVPPGRQGVRPVQPRIARGALRMNPATGAVTRLDSTTPRRPSPRWLLPPNERVKDAPLTQYQSADGKHVLVTEVVGDDRVWDKYRWTIYDGTTRRPIGEHRTHVSFAPFVVHDGLLIYETTPYARQGAAEEPAKLRAFDLKTGRQVWGVQVREVVYRGPFPP